MSPAPDPSSRPSRGRVPAVPTVVGPPRRGGSPGRPAARPTGGPRRPDAAGDEERRSDSLPPVEIGGEAPMRRRSGARRGRPDDDARRGTDVRPNRGGRSDAAAGGRRSSSAVRCRQGPRPPQGGRAPAVSGSGGEDRAAATRRPSRRSNLGHTFPVLRGRRAAAWPQRRAVRRAAGPERLGRRRCGPHRHPPRWR